MRGLFLPVLLHKHLEGQLVPWEEAEQPKPWHEPLPWCSCVEDRAGRVNLLQGQVKMVSGSGSEQASGSLPCVLVGMVTLCHHLDTLPLHRAAGRNRAEPGRDLLLTSPGLVPDGRVVIYISWKPMQLPELL